MPVVTMRQLLEAGVHFGHQTRRWNPKMKRFIFTERNGIYILDMQQTMSGIENAYRFTRDLVAGGGTILFVATKKQVQDAVEEQAIRCGMPFVNFRWLGGMLTNFRTIHDRIKRMRELEDMMTTGALEALPKKEGLRLRREYEKLARNLRGLRDLDRQPEAVYILDTKKEEIAVREARKLGIPVVAVLDTNCDPDEVDYGIPGNDDAIRSGALLTRIIADAVIEGRSMRPADGSQGEPLIQQGGEVLPGAAGEPKAEWELQLEAEEEAARSGGESNGASADGSPADAEPATAQPAAAGGGGATQTDGDASAASGSDGGTVAGDAENPSPAAQSTERDGGQSAQPPSEEAAEALSQGTDVAGDEPGDKSHPRPDAG